MNTTLNPEDVPEGLKTKQILMVTNTQSLRDLHTEFLRSIGFENVYEAADVIQATKVLKTQPIDVIIVDKELENISGV